MPDFVTFPEVSGDPWIEEAMGIRQNTNSEHSRGVLAG